MLNLLQNSATIPAAGLHSFKQRSTLKFTKLQQRGNSMSKIAQKNSNSYNVLMNLVFSFFAIVLTLVIPAKAFAYESMLTDVYRDCIIYHVEFLGYEMDNSKISCKEDVYSFCRKNFASELSEQDCHDKTAKGTALIEKYGKAIECDSGYCTITF